MVPRESWVLENFGPFSNLGSSFYGSLSLIFGWFCILEYQVLICKSQSIWKPGSRSLAKSQIYYSQARSKHKMTGGAERVAHMNPPTSVPRLKHTSWYMSNHYIRLQYLLFLSLIFRLCWLWRNRELVWDIVHRKLAKQLHLSGCSLIRILSSTTPGSVSLVHGYIHDKSVPCLFSTCLNFFYGGCCEDIVRLSI